MGKKVNIFLIGSRKSGTTSLANFLDSHSDISLSSDKESNYFDENSLDRIESLQAYHNLFQWNVENQLDASTSYTTFPICDPNTPQKIFEYNPDAKLIYIVRHPIERIISHYKMSYERGDLSGSINDALNNHPLLIACSKYYTQVERYLDFFEREKLLILNSAHLNTNETRERIQSFLNLTTNFNDQIGNDNAAGSDLRMPRSIDPLLNNRIIRWAKSKMPGRVIKMIKQRVFTSRNRSMDVNLNLASLNLLKEELCQEIDNLQRLVDFDISDWKNF